MMKQQGYETSRSIGKYGSNNGFDVVCYKGTLDDPSEIIIIEAKQFKQAKIDEFDDLVGTNYDYASGLRLNPGDNNTGLPVQMSDDWIFDHVRDKIILEGGDQTKLALRLDDSKEKISKFIFAVDKSEGSSFFLKLSDF